MADILEWKQISENISKTQEGYLLCKNVAVSRTGQFDYAVGQVPLGEADSNGIIKVNRDEASLFDPVTIASFEGKPVTINHPNRFLSPENYKDYTVGKMQNVRRGEGDDADKLMADLLICDAEAIGLIETNDMREVSIGYSSSYDLKDDGSVYQKQILGNHISLVSEGRCGPECAVIDHKETNKKGFTMKLKDTIISIFNKTLDEALPDENKETVKDEAVTMEMVQSLIDGLKQEMAMLAAKIDEMKAAESEVDSAMDEPVVKDAATADAPSPSAETMALAEILAPSIAATHDVKARALDQAYKTHDGKQIIDRLLMGDSLDMHKNSNILFAAAANEMKNANNKIVATVDPIHQVSAIDTDSWAKRVKELQTEKG